MLYYSLISSGITRGLSKPNYQERGEVPCLVTDTSTARKSRSSTVRQDVVTASSSTTVDSVAPMDLVTDTSFRTTERTSTTGVSRMRRSPSSTTGGAPSSSASTGSNPQDLDKSLNCPLFISNFINQT